MTSLVRQKVVYFFFFLIEVFTALVASPTIMAANVQEKAMANPVTVYKAGGRSTSAMVKMSAMAQISFFMS